MMLNLKNSCLIRNALPLFLASLWSLQMVDKACPRYVTMMKQENGMGHQVGTYTTALITSLFFNLTFVDSPFIDKSTFRRWVEGCVEGRAALSLHPPLMMPTAFHTLQASMATTRASRPLPGCSMESSCWRMSQAGLTRSLRWRACLSLRPAPTCRHSTRPY